jgi:hypothetical protein
VPKKRKEKKEVDQRVTDVYPKKVRKEDSKGVKEV